MTRKDYALIANAIRLARIETGQPDDYALNVAVGFLANALQSDNPKFDRERFVKACRPDEEEK